MCRGGPAGVVGVVGMTVGVLIVFVVLVEGVMCKRDFEENEDGVVCEDVREGVIDWIELE